MRGHPGNDLYALSGRLIVALDCPTLADAEVLAIQVAPSAAALKVGLELFVAEGPSAVRAIQRHAPVFLDLKLHDVPETVDRAVARACGLGVALLTVHTSGGPAMLERAVQRAEREATGLTLLGVTVLTSLDAGDLVAVGVPRTPGDQAVVLAQLGVACGLRGFVCSPVEVGDVRKTVGADVALVTPGVRPEASRSDDQKRVDTPAGAVARGATAVVVGRPIRDAANPAAAAAEIASELARA